MRKFKFMPKMAAGMMAVAMTFGSLNGLGMGQLVAAYAEETAATVSSVVISGDKYVAPGKTKLFRAMSFDAKGGFLNDTYKWAVEGSSDAYVADSNADGTKIDESTGELTVSEKETAKELTIKATSVTTNSVNATWKVTIFAGAVLDINYENMTASISSTVGDDSFLFLEVLKKADGVKGSGTIYCFEEEQADIIDLSFLKLSKDVSVLVYGDKNTTPLPAFTIKAQPKKPSVKYVAGKNTVADSFTVKNGKVEDLQYKTQYGMEWSDFVGENYSIMNDLDGMIITGTTLLVRSLTTDATTGEVIAPPSAEIKVKIAASPKAPKVTLDYAKNTVKLPKNSEIRIPGWEIPKDGAKNEDGEVEEAVWDPFYYQVADADLAKNPDSLAETLVTKYIEDFNAAQGKLADTLKWKETDNEDGIKALTTTLAKDDDGKEIEGTNDKENMLDEMAGGYKVLVRTRADKKAASQPAFVEVKAAQEIQIRQKKVGEEDQEVDGATVKVPIMEDENVIVLMEKKTNTDGTVTMEYSSKTVTFTWSEEGLELNPSDATTFEYSLDGSKYSKLSKKTTIKMDKIDKNKSVAVRAMGVKENLKNNVVGNWASNVINVPVAVSTVTINGEKEITAATSSVSKEYTVTVKDFFGNEVSNPKITWAATGTSEKVTFAEDETSHKQMLTVATGATATTVKITATCNGVKGEFEVTVKAAPQS